MIVCVCKRISDKIIIRDAMVGATFDDIQFNLGVATQCGRCESCARDIVAQCQGPQGYCHGGRAHQSLELAVT